MVNVRFKKSSTADHSRSQMPTLRKEVLKPIIFYNTDLTWTTVVYVKGEIRHQGLPYLLYLVNFDVYLDSPVLWVF